jgi:hypothetical protein
MQNAECRMIRRLQFSICNLQFAILLLAFASLTTSAIAQDKKRVLIPFDFVSQFDDGRTGQILGDMIWKKINADGGFILPESMQDVRDYCRSHQVQPSPDDSLEKMKKIIKDDFDAQIAVWGSVERAPGTEGEIYDLAIKCVDFSAEPKVIYDIKARTKSVSEIPHLYVKQMLGALYHRPPEQAHSADPLAEANWAKNPNLVGGGDFQTGAGGVPKGWETAAGQQREPLGKLVQWVAEGGNPQNKIIRFTFDKAVAEEEGVMYYSDYFPVQEGATYRFQCRWKTNAPSAKVFIKCYDDMRTTYKEGATGNPSNPAQRREVYRSQENLKGRENTWNIHTEDFTPTHTRYSPKWGRVMLYAYLRPGVVEFDDVVVKQILPPPNNLSKQPRQSLDTRVTDKDIEEDQRRSDEAKKQGKK